MFLFSACDIMHYRVTQKEATSFPRGLPVTCDLRRSCLISIALLTIVGAYIDTGIHFNKRKDIVVWHIISEKINLQH